MADKKIDSKIPLTDAMGVTRGTTPEEFIKRWNDWSTKFPKEKDKLNDTIVAALDALTIIIEVETSLTAIMATLETVVTALNDAYNFAMACVPGVGSANGVKVVAEKGKQLAKQSIDKVIAQMQTLPQKIYDTLAVQTKVDEGAVL
jgi:hypothetical protein